MLHVSAHDLLTQLRAGRGDGSFDRKMQRLATVDLPHRRRPRPLRPLAHDEPIDVYEIIRRRYQRASTIVTSNRSLEGHPLFQDALLASAAMDRLLHRAHVVFIEGDSFRNPPPSRRQARPGRNGTAEAGAR